MSVTKLGYSHRVLETPYGPVLGCSYRWPTGQYCAIHTDQGILGCGLYDCNVATKFSMPVAIARGTPEKPLREPEDLLDAKVAEVSEAAKQAGVVPGMTGLEAIACLLRRP
jgi:uncharacterized protein YunC (DUF1805 family)